MSKYGSRVLIVDGERFDSQREYARWQELRLLERAGEISALERQVPYELAPSVRLDGRRKPALRYYADFRYRDALGRVVVEDAKGVRTEAYRVKRHLMATVHGIVVVEV